MPGERRAPLVASSAVPAVGRARRTWPQRLLITFNVAVVVAVLMAGGAAGWFWYRFGQLPRVTLAAGILTPEGEGDAPLGVQNWLLVGSDSREFVASDEDEDSFGTSDDVGPARADTIIVLRIDPEAEQAAMLSIPRDLWLPIAGTGGNQRINTAFTHGPAQLIQTITDNFGIPIHHYAQVDFAGFKGVVDAVGGVEVWFPSPARDRMAGLDVQETGCVNLSGDQALAYVRSRHYQYQEDGRWRDDPSGDLGRISRQQDFIRRAIREALSNGLTNPVKLNDLVRVGIENVQIDEEIGAGDILKLGARFGSLDPSTIQMVTLPVVGDRVGQASVLRLVEREAQAALDIFRGVTSAPEAVAPNEVRVRVLNGTGTAGQAGATAADLRDARFPVAGVGDGARGTDATIIRYGTGQRAKAELLARWLAGPAQLVEDGDVVGVDLELTTGADWDGVRDEAAPPPATEPPPTTEAPPPPPPPEDEEPADDEPPC